MVAEMIDMSDKGSECEESEQLTLKKLCVDCGTSKTPLWRKGPAGPKSLCNACGVKRNRKKRSLESNKGNDHKERMEKKVKCRISGSNNISINSTNSRSLDCSSESSSKDRLMAMWNALNPQNVRVEDLNEEQQAALLLLTFSHQYNSY